MHHLLLSALLILTLFVFGVRKYEFLSVMPLGLFLLAFAVESGAGFGQTSHALFHFAYDTSYILTVLGLLFLVRSILKKRRIAVVCSAVCLAAVPLAQLLLSSR